MQLLGLTIARLLLGLLLQVKLFMELTRFCFCRVRLLHASVLWTSSWLCDAHHRQPQPGKQFLRLVFFPVLDFFQLQIHLIRQPSKIRDKRQK